ncbi:cell envelope biogenesis protein OmpA [Polaribacter sp. PL03]|uniref:cell envelope biogenesis protein OmpA n=1 Tax=Polaribacter sp. PL03 TaxID=3088353 RepID=UPI0029D30320|nr:cell envelope biogenesis protein OmpA [Polaribacter sp. PL03]MDX6747155.1 cell envelope biogenesis protein OmpA [Polaribacter sp. PL03]
MGKPIRDSKNDNRFELLKELLLEDDREKFTALSKDIIDKRKISETVNPLIDLKLENLRENFPTDFGKTITETIKVQIRESQDEVVEALYPIMGKLVKKFIVVEIAKLSESINKTIKEKFSISQILKRFFNGRKNNANLILEEVFEPTIEEVFVIEKDSGLLAGNYSRGNIAEKDMVSGMLTAIKSFAEDAFSKEGQNLEDIKFETFQLSIQNFKTIYIATAISGVINSDFKEVLLDKINNLAEIILRDRTYLSEEKKLSKLIQEILINTDELN